MPDYWSVPIDNSLYTGLDSQIAKGPDFSFIGNLPNAYWQGQQAQYQNRNQNAFPDGLPTLKKPDGTPVTDSSGKPIIDYPAIGNTLAKAGGTADIGAAVGTASFPTKAVHDATTPTTPDQQSTANPPPQPQGTIPPNTGATITSGRPQPQTTDTLTPQQITQANPNGMPQAVAMPPSATDPNTTPRMLAQRTPGVDPQSIATAAGVGIDQPIPPDLQTRLKVAGVIRQASPGVQNGAPQPPQAGAPQAQSPGQVQPMPQGGQPGQNLQTGSDDLMARADKAHAIGDQLAASAAALAMNPYTKASSDAIKARADAAYKMEQQYRDAALAAGKPTNEQLNARDPTVQQTATAQAARNKLAEGDAANYQNDYKGVSLAARGAQNQIDEAKLGKSMTMQPGFSSGQFGELTKTYNQFKAALGPEYAAAQPQEVFDKVVNNMLIQQVRSLGQSGVGRVLQTEVNTMRQGIASLGITPVSNRALFELSSRVAQQTRDVAGIASQVNAAVTRGQIPPGQYSQALNDATQKYYDSHPLVSDDEKQDPKILGAPDAPADYATKWSLVQQQNWARGLGIQAGDPVRIPDGTVRHAP